MRVAVVAGAAHQVQGSGGPGDDGVQVVLVLRHGHGHDVHPHRAEVVGDHRVDPLRLGQGGAGRAGRVEELQRLPVVSRQAEELAGPARVDVVAPRLLVADAEGGGRGRGPGGCPRGRRRCRRCAGGPPRTRSPGAGTASARSGGPGSCPRRARPGGPGAAPGCRPRRGGAAGRGRRRRSRPPCRAAAPAGARRPDPTPARPPGTPPDRSRGGRRWGPGSSRPRRPGGRA